LDGKDKKAAMRVIAIKAAMKVMKILYFLLSFSS
jgi:hypothetical protein